MVIDKFGRLVGKGAKAIGGGGLEVIKWPEHLDPEQYIAWRYPKTDIKYGSVLIVDESQKALFFRDGKLLGVLDSGRHILDTQNVPFLHGLVSELYGETIFKANVVFVNLRQYYDEFGDRIFLDTVGVHILLDVKYYFTVDENRLETFYVSIMGMKEEVTVEDVREYLKPFISQTLLDSFGEYAVQQMQMGRMVQTYAEFTRMLNEFTEATKALITQRVAEQFGIKITDIRIRPEISEEDKRLLQMSGPRAFAAMFMREWEGREKIAESLGGGQNPATAAVAPFIFMPWMMYPPMPPQYPQPPVTPPASPGQPGAQPGQPPGPRPPGPPAPPGPQMPPQAPAPYPYPYQYPPQYPYAPPGAPQQYPRYPPQQYPPQAPAPQGAPPQPYPPQQYPQQPQQRPPQPGQQPPPQQPYMGMGAAVMPAQPQPAQPQQPAPRTQPQTTTPVGTGAAAPAATARCPYCGRPIPMLAPVCPYCARRIKWCPDGRPVKEEESC